MTTRRGLIPAGTAGAGYAYRAHVPAVQVRAKGDVSVITGFAAVYNRYSQNLGGFVEQIAPGAFDDSLANDDQIASWNHDYGTILGRRSASTLDLASGADGVQYEIPIDSEDPDHVRVVRKIERGDVRGSSFSMRIAPDGETWSYTDQGMLLSTVTRASLLEVAPVVWPAYPATEDAEMAVHLRSLADQSGVDIGTLVEAARSMRLTEVVRSSDVPPADSTGAPAAEVDVRAARWRVRLAELTA